MHARRYIAWIAGLVLTLALPAFAVQVTMDVQPRVAQLGENLRLLITVEGASNAQEPAPPHVPDFDVRGAGQQRSFSFNNGQTSHSITFTYILTPTKTGRFQVGPFAYEDNGQTINLPAVDVEIVAPGNAQQGQSTSISDLVRAKFDITRTNLYPQTSFDLVLSVYFRGVNLDRNMNISGLEQPGLSLEQFREVRGGREVIDGQVYDVLRYACRVTPLTSGTFEISPALQIGILVERRRGSDPFFSAFFGSTEVQPYRVQTERLRFTVNDFPKEGRPTDFSGAVGRFRLEVAANPTTLAAGDPITVTIALAGEGNLASMRPPQFVDSDRFRVYEPKLVARAGESVGGDRVIYEQVVIPRSVEVKELPALTFSYFDPDGGVYREVSGGAIALTVSGPTNTSAQIVEASAASKRVLGEDIGYLKPIPGTLARLEDLTKPPAPWVLGVQVVPPLALALLFWVARKRSELQTNVAKARRVQAPKVAQKALKDAEAAISSADWRTYNDALWRAFADYFAHRLNLPPGEVSSDSVATRLRNGGADASMVDRLEAILANCEAARYGVSSPRTDATDPSSAKAVVDELGRILLSCERIRV